MKLFKTISWSQALVWTVLLPFLSACTNAPSRFNGRRNDGMEENMKVFLILSVFIPLVWLGIDYFLTYYNHRKSKSIIKYGQELEQLSFPIGGKENWNRQEAMALEQEIRKRVFSGLKTRMSTQSENASLAQDSLYISGQGFTYHIKEDHILVDHGYPKTFLKIEYTHHSGHKLNFFVHYQLVGNFLVAHHLVFLKGKNTIWKLLVLWFCMPPLLLFKYLFNRGSLVKKHINIIDPSFFDSLDLNAFWTTVHESIWESTEAILKEKGLLTEQIQTIINQSITNHNISNTQNVSVSGSGNSMQGFNQSTTI